MQTHIILEENAVRRVLEMLRSRIGYSWSNIHYLNKGRYCIVEGNPSIAILLKTEPFYNFSRMFPDEKGVGDSINCESLKLFVQKDVKYVYTLFRDGKLYRASLDTILCNSKRWIQKEGTAVRSFSIHLYERVN